MNKVRVKGERLPSQRQFLLDRSFFLTMFGGYGSGKTHGICLKLLQLADENKGLPGGLLCPTIKMFKRDVFPEFRNLCAINGIKMEYRRGDGEIYLPWTDSTIYIFHGQDDGESIKGPNLAYMAINEGTLLTWNTFKSAIGRVRLKSAPFPQVAMSGTPEDFNWAYDVFIDKPMKNSSVIYSDTRTNRFAADWYVDMLLSSYDEIAAQQYVEGKFVPKTGLRALHRFDRNKHACYDDSVVTGRGEKWVHVDFNVYPMAATIYEFNPEYSVPLRAYDEVCLHGADTKDLCDALSYKMGAGWQEARIFPDPAGIARKTSAIGGITDISIMEQYGFRNMSYKKKLSVRDCLNAANNMLSKNKVVFHKQCVETIRDMERVKLKQGSHDIDKSDPERSHWVDGFKNMADYEFPVIQSYTSVVARKFR